jgi:hypothetical protein
MLLRYDEGERKIGLAPLNRRARRDDRAYAITYHPNQHQALVAARLYLRKIGWDGQRYRLDAHWNEKDRLWECTAPDWEAHGLKLLTPAVIMMPKGERLAIGYNTFERLSWMSSSPAISIIGNGQIALNVPLTRMLRSEGAAQMLLLFDKGRRRIGLAPLKKGARRDDRAYAITYLPNRRNATVYPRLFLRQIGWDGQRYQLDAYWNEKDKCWQCNLPDWKAGGSKLLTLAVSEQRTG